MMLSDATPFGLDSGELNRKSVVTGDEGLRIPGRI
jgi:hypothetical protein